MARVQSQVDDSGARAPKACTRLPASSHRCSNHSGTRSVSFAAEWKQQEPGRLRGARCWQRGVSKVNPLAGLLDSRSAAYQNSSNRPESCFFSEIEKQLPRFA
jgi:hypothetical protein